MDQEYTQSSTLVAPYSITAAEAITALHSSPNGLDQHEAAARYRKSGANILPQPPRPGPGTIFLRQFTSPLIYVLLFAAVVSLAIQEWSDASFIVIVLLLNAAIGTVQEFMAQRTVNSLNKLVQTPCHVIRAGEEYMLDASALVTGDVVVLEPGQKVPADLRLLKTASLQVDESLLTGESVPVSKNSDTQLPVPTPLSGRANMAMAGTLVAHGHAQGIVTATGLHTELGRIAATLLGKSDTPTPLQGRMTQLVRAITWVICGTIVGLMLMALYAGQSFTHTFVWAAALAVAAIPEGLPVALTTALAVAVRRMARRNVIVRRLMAVEALGSCTYIATDKTGTLTANRLMARRLLFPDDTAVEVTGGATNPDGVIMPVNGQLSAAQQYLLLRLCTTAALANDAFLGKRNDHWVQQGDAVDVALLVLAHKAGLSKITLNTRMPQCGVIPFESENLFAASLHQCDGHMEAFVKGALERLLPMCGTMAGMDGQSVPLDSQALEHQAAMLAEQGYRVLALASGKVALPAGDAFAEPHLRGLTLLGLVGLMDPLRPEAKTALTACRQAGIEVAMVTGDHPVTALAIARELGLAQIAEEVLTGVELRQEASPASTNALSKRARVFARIEPQQKREIVEALQAQGHFVAVSGDGANDAPALMAAQVGVAMGRSGTDVARDSADLVILDDNFASIVAGVEEGRIAYANIRKIIYFLLSTGFAELLLFILSSAFGLPVPLSATQLLWLNLVTDSIQAVGLAFEPAEGNELNVPPRSPQEPIFNRMMLERVIIGGGTMGLLAYGVYGWMLAHGDTLEETRNAILFLLVLFENLNVFNSRSERRPLRSQAFFANPLLLLGVIVTQGVQIVAMHTPWLNRVLTIGPISPRLWIGLFLLTAVVIVVMEAHKRWRSQRFDNMPREENMNTAHNRV